MIVILIAFALIFGMVLVVYVAYLYFILQPKPNYFPNFYPDEPEILTPMKPNTPRPRGPVVPLPPPPESDEPDEPDEPAAPPPPPPPPPRIYAEFSDGRTTFNLTEEQYQRWLEWRRRQEEEQARELAVIEQARQQAQAEAQARAQREAEAKAGMPRWVVELADYYRLKEFDQVKLFKDWIGLITQFVLTRYDGNFPVRKIWKEVMAEYGRLAPDPRFTSYHFFSRLNDCLIDHHLADRGAPGIPTKLIKHRLPKWAKVAD